MNFQIPPTTSCHQPIVEPEARMQKLAIPTAFTGAFLILATIHSALAFWEPSDARPNNKSESSNLQGAEASSGAGELG
ncbi:hypothetical protein PG999_007386 [Apiospora kogelbergensis]|uniref:Energy transducer TonB n=1 Tax=Apiospora kogelbergensis TaxID=1337665 RepID=A0AAW0QY53_9PEZI